MFGVLAASLPSIGFAQEVQEPDSGGKVFHRYPSIDDALVGEMVGASHFNLERVKELVSARPEMARASWDWGFGDWETAIGAASHVGRRDIAEFLLANGARPDHFTFAMLGAFESVKAMIEASPGLQRIAGPHGFSLMHHARMGLRAQGVTDAQKAQSERLVAYLEAFGDADGTGKNPMLTAAERAKYVGDYRYGDGPTEGLSVKENLREMLSLGKLGAFGGALLAVREGVFTYNGCPSVEITFQREGDRVVSLTVKEPGLTLVAKRV